MARLGVVTTPLHQRHADAVVPVTVGTVLWGVALVATLLVRPTLEKHGTQWWVWTCATGFGLGLFGCWWVRRRRARLAEQAGQPSDAG